MSIQYLNYRMGNTGALHSMCSNKIESSSFTSADTMLSDQRDRLRETPRWYFHPDKYTAG